MKSLKIAVGIFIGLILINIYLFFYLKNTVESVMEKTEEVKVSVMNQDKEQTVSVLEEIQSDVEKYQRVWHVMTNHGEVDKVQSTLTMCIGYAEFGSPQDVLANLYTLQYNIEHLFEREKINLSNIF